MLLEFACVVGASALAVDGDERGLVAAHELDLAHALEHQRHVHVRLVGELAVERVERRRVERRHAKARELNPRPLVRAAHHIACDREFIGGVALGQG